MKKIFLFSLFVLVAVFGFIGNVSAQVCGDGVCSSWEKCDCNDCPFCTLPDVCNPAHAASDPTTGCGPNNTVGDGVCEYPVERCDNCPVDCPPCVDGTCVPLNDFADQYGCVSFSCGNGICDPGETCVTCADCMHSGCECCNPWLNAALTDAGGCALDPSACSGIETCYHLSPDDPSVSCTLPKTCQKVLTVFPWVDCSDNSCGDDDCEGTENCDSCPADCICSHCAPGPGADAAGCVFPVADGTDLVSPINPNNFGEFIENIVDFIFYFGLAFSSLLFVIAGFHFITAGGDAGRLNSAKSIAGWALAGILTILFAKGIIEAIRSLLEVA